MDRKTLWDLLETFVDLFLLSLLFLLCCIPIFTAFAAAVALYDCVIHCIRGGEGSICRRFFRTMRASLGRSAALMLCWCAAFAVLGFGYRTLCLSGQTSPGAAALSLIYLVSLLIPAGTFCWLIPLEAHYAYRFSALHKTAFLLSIGRLPATVLLVAIPAGLAAACFYAPLLLPFAPGIGMLLQSFVAERTFRRQFSTQGDAADD